jgi:prevent-host-death family protein
MIKVNVLEAKNRLSELLRAVQAGEEVIIANRGQPVARLVAAAPAQPERGSAAAIFAALDANPLPPELRRSKEEIDAYLAEERDSWD